MRRVAAGTLLVGALDIVEVILFYMVRGVSPMRVLQGVAAGWLGRAAFRGGAPAAVLGLVTHFFIACVVVAIYVLARRKMPPLTRRPLVMGALYGLAVYAVMQFVVLPLSASGAANSSWPVTANLLFAHVFCVGIPTALVARS